MQPGRYNRINAAVLESIAQRAEGEQQRLITLVALLAHDGGSRKQVYG